MLNIKHIFINSDWGKISVEFDKNYVIYSCSLIGELSYDSKLGEWPELKDKFINYLNGKKVNFNEKLYLDDSPNFTKEVYQYLQKNLKWGNTISYGEVAKKVNNPKAARAIGQVMNKNIFPMFVP